MLAGADLDVSAVSNDIVGSEWCSEQRITKEIIKGHANQLPSAQLQLRTDKLDCSCSVNSPARVLLEALQGNLSRPKRLFALACQSY